ncbi:MAG: hypothetical protein ACM336_05465 [Acidobacteriota bacterium]
MLKAARGPVTAEDFPATSGAAGIAAVRRWRLRSQALPVVLFVLLALLYHSNGRPIAAGDSLPCSLIPFSLLMDHSANLDRFGPSLWANRAYSRGIVIFRNGHYHSFYPIAQGVLISPLYLPLILFSGAHQWEPETLLFVARICEKAVAVLLAAVTSVVMFRMLTRVVSNRWALLLAVLFGLGTNNWSICSQALWQHTSGQLFIVVSLYFLVRWVKEGNHPRLVWWASVFAGLSILIRPTNVLFPIAVSCGMVFTSRSVKACIRFAAIPALCGLCVAADNMLIFGNALGGYGAYAGRHGEGVVALCGLLLSPGRGLFVYTPFLLFAFFGLRRDARERNELFVAVSCGLYAMLQVLVVANWPAWWGGFCWGPRLLTEIIPTLMLLVALGVRRFAASRKWMLAFVGFAAWSVFVQAVGVYCYPNGAWDAAPVSVDVRSARLWDLHDSPISRTLRGGVYRVPWGVHREFVTRGPRAAREKADEVRFILF